MKSITYVLLLCISQLGYGQAVVGVPNPSPLLVTTNAAFSFDLDRLKRFVDAWQAKKHPKADKDVDICVIVDGKAIEMSYGELRWRLLGPAPAMPYCLTCINTTTVPLTNPIKVN